jgi:hypothetical protein
MRMGFSKDEVYQMPLNLMMHLVLVENKMSRLERRSSIQDMQMATQPVKPEDFKAYMHYLMNG